MTYENEPGLVWILLRYAESSGMRSGTARLIKYEFNNLILTETSRFNNIMTYKQGSRFQYSTKLIKENKTNILNEKGKSSEQTRHRVATSVFNYVFMIDL